MRLEVQPQAERDRLFVFHDQDALHPASSSGSRMVNVLP